MKMAEAFAARLRASALADMLPPWAPLAACAERAPNQHPWEPMFADEVGRRADGAYAWPQKVQHAINVCRSCPVRIECLRYAIESEHREEQTYWASDLHDMKDDVRFGIYGGVPGVIRSEHRDDADPVASCDAWFVAHFGVERVDEGGMIPA